MLSVTFAYTGVMLAFWSGVYGTSLGRTKNWSIGSEDAKSLVGLHGIVIGAGEIVGGMTFLKWTSNKEYKVYKNVFKSLRLEKTLAYDLDII